MKARARRARAAGWLVLVAGAVVAAPPAARAQGAPAGAQPATASAQGAPAGAQPAMASADAAQASRDADAAFARGKELYRHGKLDAAYEAYRTAWSLKQSYDIAANLANTELQRGMKVEAAEHLAFCLRSFPATGNSAQHEQIRAQFRAVRKEVGSIVVQANVEGAAVSFDGAAVGRTPFRHEVFVKPGSIVVEARLAGHEPSRVTLDVPAGETNTANLVLLPPREPPAPPAPLVPRAEAPAPIPAPAGGDTGAPRPEVLIAGGAVAGAGVIAGVVFTVLANANASDAEEQRSLLRQEGGLDACKARGAPARCTELKDAVGARYDFSNAAFWSFVGAGTVGIGTLVYGLISRSPVNERRVHVTPLVGSNGLGIGVRGGF
ncbi:PEGA domain-containing protein [Sorangium sp. So ce128]|uniref:PEGA domain-containing protein n=1 Tax=Sorangium sp. So ce128 TaxID=3133281 RepID=UPI003F62842A